MRARKKLEIKELVKSLLLQADIKKPPINVKKIAKVLGAEIHEHDFKDQDAISGVLVKENDKILIGINSSHSSNRKRFTIAHEIGHLLLHSHTSSHIDRHAPSLIQLRDEASSLAIDEDEIESNAFAAELIIPDYMIKKDFQKIADSGNFDENNVEDLAKKYNVSVQAMTYRLMNLGYIYA